VWTGVDSKHTADTARRLAAAWTSATPSGELRRAQTHLRSVCLDHLPPAGPPIRRGEKRACRKPWPKPIGFPGIENVRSIPTTKIPNTPLDRHMDRHATSRMTHRATPVSAGYWRNLSCVRRLHSGNAPNENEGDDRRNLEKLEEPQPALRKCATGRAKAGSKSGASRDPVPEGVSSVHSLAAAPCHRRTF